MTVITEITMSFHSNHAFRYLQCMKPQMHVLERSIFSLDNVIVRLNKIMNRADKNWAHFKKIKYSKASSCEVFGSWKKTGISKTGLHEVGRKQKNERILHGFLSILAKIL